VLSGANLKMKIGLVVAALIVLGGLAATSGYAAVAHSGPPKTAALTSRAPPAHPGAAKIIVKPVPTKFAGAPFVNRGSLGGPVNKGPNINGTGNKPKH